jgi:hypothetical protein
MNHPTQNEWLLYLDGEASPKDAARLLEHLEQCPMCAAEIGGWQRSAQKLQRMSFPALRQVRPHRLGGPLPVSFFVKWGLAAAIVLFVGFAFGRLSALRAASLKRTVAAEVRDQVRRELQSDLLTALDPAQEVKDGFQKQLRLNVESALAKTAAQSARQYRDLMQVAQQQRQQDQKRLLTLILDVHDQQIADTLALRRDLETAVSTADSDLRQDSRRISQLAETMLSAQR